VSKDTPKRRLSSRRNVMKASFGAISRATSSGLASANTNDTGDIQYENELQKVDENDSYVLFKIESSDESKYLKSNKETGKTTYVEATELSNEHGLAQSDVSVAIVPSSAGGAIVKRSESYRRLFESCAGDCQGHVLLGSSHEIEKHIAGASKAVIGYAIVSAAIAIAPAGAAAALGSGRAADIVKTAISGATTAEIEGNNITLATVDTDVKYVVGVDEVAYPGVGIGPWKPNGSALMMYPYLPLDTHQGGCD